MDRNCEMFKDRRKFARGVLSSVRPYNILHGRGARLGDAAWYLISCSNDRSSEKRIYGRGRVSGRIVSTNIKAVVDVISARRTR